MPICEIVHVLVEWGGKEYKNGVRGERDYKHGVRGGGDYKHGVRGGGDYTCKHGVGCISDTWESITISIKNVKNHNYWYIFIIILVYSILTGPKL